MLRLVTIPISHYCEKARWALDRAGLPYREERHIQVVHQVAARRAGGGATVPVLVTPDGAVAQSCEILEWVDERLPADERLFPEDPDERREVVDLCRRLDDDLGPAGRRLIYVHIFALKDLALKYNNAGVPRWEDRALRLGWPVVERAVGRVLGITPGVETEDEAVVWREFDAMADRLADGRPYLCGDRFTAADLTFAALSAPMTAPPGYGTPLPQPDMLPAGTRTMLQLARDHPAGRHALAMYAAHRSSPVVSAAA